MGLFDYPRINVWGTQVVNPGTANNDSASPGTELTVTSDTERVRVMTAGKTDEEFRQWVTQLDEDGLLRCQFNYYGDHSFRFIDVRVRSVALGDGELVTDKAREPLIGGSLYLSTAHLCDNNPEGFNSTQVFSEALELRAPGALAGNGVFLSRRPLRATTRYLNWYRNVSYHGLFGLPPNGADGQLSSGGAGGASATFQHGIEVHKEDLDHLASQTDALENIVHKLLARPESRAMTALVEALRRPEARGLIFRYNLYLCFPRHSDTALAKDYAAGLKTENPSFGLLLGTLAPWYRGEPSSITMGRFFKPAASYQNPYRQGPSASYYLAPAVGVVDSAAERVRLDMSNCLPEDGPQGDKYNLGEVTVGVRKATPPNTAPSTNTSPITTIGPIVNEKDVFIDQGGIYDVCYRHLTAEQKATLESDDHELVLSTGLSGVLLYEPEYMVSTDSSCNYLDQLPPGERWDDPKVRAELAQQPFAPLRGEVDLRVLRRGRVPRGPTTVRVEQWRETPTGFPNQYGVYRYPTLLHTTSVVVEDGVGTLVLRPTDGTGLRLMRLVPPDNWPQDIQPPTLAQLTFQEFFLELRVLPYDDYSKVGDDDVTWKLIYEEIFRYYNLILPAMSLRLDMSDPTIWEAPTSARYVLRTTNPALWSSPAYMPRTRDLSKYRRELLWRFCRKVLRRAGIPD